METHDRNRFGAQLHFDKNIKEDVKLAIKDTQEALSR
jgi:hypothetical protein